MNPTNADHYVERVVDLLDPSLNQIHNLSLEEARLRVLSGQPEAVRTIDGSFALLARAGKTVRMARSLDRPMRYFLAKRAEGPALIVADRIDNHNQLKSKARRPVSSYTRMSRRITLWNCNSSVVRIPIRPTLVSLRRDEMLSLRIWTKSVAATSVLWPMRLQNGCNAFLATNRSA
jgi:hypothetical protein